MDRTRHHFAPYTDLSSGLARLSATTKLYEWPTVPCHVYIHPFNFSAAATMGLTVSPIKMINLMPRRSISKRNHDICPHTQRSSFAVARCVHPFASAPPPFQTTSGVLLRAPAQALATICQHIFDDTMQSKQQGEARLENGMRPSIRHVLFLKGI